jgi:hypothetical protein
VNSACGILHVYDALHNPVFQILKTEFQAHLGRAMALGVSRRPGFDHRSVHVGFVVEKVALGQVFPLVLRFSPVSFIPSVLHYSEKRRKLIIYITWLHNKAQGCGASVASAARPFTKKSSPVFLLQNYVIRKKNNNI